MKSTLWPDMKQQRTFPWRKSHSRLRKTGWYHLILLLVCTSFLPSTSTCQQKNAAPQTACVTLHSCWWWFSFEFKLFGDDWRRRRLNITLSYESFCASPAPLSPWLSLTSQALFLWGSSHPSETSQKMQAPLTCSCVLHRSGKTDCSRRW